ncbi:MAG: FecR domain-containing protein [Algoriphagus sp.]|uniref:FecR family protein n=1 Tax=Algoriphagus sp. TaxID=1872435 RepID=UPI0027312991|nr:FecR family protein [Algoriphagus sp.]MDP2039952.1 FecR domain-containing protein [Algoriphagus sp.]MDP3470343.1 FecR domain-containing protein [Algoriphagus sp.]
MNYKDYDIANFITDEFFIQWIKSPNENNSHFWEKWMAQHPEKRAMVNEAANLIRSVKYAHSPEFTDKMYVETFEQILKADNEHSSVKNFKPTPISSSSKGSFLSFIPLRGIAASLLVLFCLWAQYEAFQYQPQPIEKPKIPMITRSNPAGQKSIIDLPDGTKIHLNSESEIEFPKEFSVDFRLVRLKGEAFFEVQKENRPFLVESGNAKIHVLGTSFNVKQKTNEPLYVALVTGKVRVNAENGDQVTLKPDEMLVMEQGGEFYKTNFDPLDEIGWKDNFLVFKSTTFSDVIGKLENWYGVKIAVQGRIDPNWTYSGVYKDEMLENILRGICMTSGMTYQIDKKQITITNPK